MGFLRGNGVFHPAAVTSGLLARLLFWCINPWPLQQEGSIHGQAGQGGGAEQRFLEDREPCSKVSSAAAGTSVALHREKVSLSSPSVSMP